MSTLVKIVCGVLLGLLSLFILFCIILSVAYLLDPAMQN